MPVADVKNPLALAAIGALMVAVLLAILGSLLWGIIRLAQGQTTLPRYPRRPVPWGAASVGGVVLLYVGLNLLVLAGLGIGRRVFAANAGPLSMSEIILLNLLLQFAIATLTPALLSGTCRGRLADLGLRAEGWPLDVARGMWTCFLLLPVVYLTSFLAQFFWKSTAHPVAEALGKELNGPTIVVTVLAAVVVAPLCEEILFRGVLLAWLWKVLSGVRPKPPIPPGDPLILFLDDFGNIDAEPPRPAAPARFHPGMDWLANVLASALFAGMHFAQWPAPVPLFFLSLALGEVYRRTGSLFAPIALHATFNGLSTLFMILISSAGLPLPGLK